MLQLGVRKGQSRTSRPGLSTKSNALGHKRCCFPAERPPWEIPIMGKIRPIIGNLDTAPTTLQPWGDSGIVQK